MSSVLLVGGMLSRRGWGVRGVGWLVFVDSIYFLVSKYLKVFVVCWVVWVGVCFLVKVLGSIR